MLWSFVKVLVFSVVIILTHCYYALPQGIHSGHLGHPARGPGRPAASDGLDVKVRGVIVGEVREVEPTGQNAVELAILPGS